MIQGIHHITAIASDARKNVHFYTEVLGLRLVKKTVNQDDTETYHLFFGDAEGHPGMDLTFFIFLPSMQGKRGNGLVTTISLSIPEDSIAFWQERFSKYKIKHECINRFSRKRILFYDDDDQQLELVAVPVTELDSPKDLWTKNVSQEYAIRSFYSASLSVHSLMLIEPVLLSVFGYQKIAQAENKTLYKVEQSKRAAYLEVTEDPLGSIGLNAAGTVHHIAFRAKDEQHQNELRKRVLELGIQTTDVIDRFYFKSVYFRIPAGILFEIATDKPGFTADETVEELGTKLALPPFLENERIAIESRLIKLE